MDGEYNGNPYFLMDDLGGKPTIFGNPHMSTINPMICREHRCAVRKKVRKKAFFSPGFPMKPPQWKVQGEPPVPAIKVGWFISPGKPMCFRPFIGFITFFYNW